MHSNREIPGVGFPALWNGDTQRERCRTCFGNGFAERSQRDLEAVASGERWPLLNQAEVGVHQKRFCRSFKGPSGNIEIDKEDDTARDFARGQCLFVKSVLEGREKLLKEGLGESPK